MASPILPCLWRPTHPTLAELLKTNGYHTAAFIGAVILDSKTLAPGLDRGFDFYDNFPAQPKTKSRWGRVERRGMEVVQHAEAWMTAHPAGPHFVWVHLYDPHDPYEPPPPYSQTYKDRLYDGEIAYADSVAGWICWVSEKERAATTTRLSSWSEIMAKAWASITKTLTEFFSTTPPRTCPSS